MSRPHESAGHSRLEMGLGQGGLGTHDLVSAHGRRAAPPPAPPCKAEAGLFGPTGDAQIGHTQDPLAQRKVRLWTFVIPESIFP